MRDTRTLTILRDGLGAPHAVAQPRFHLKVVRGPDRRRELTCSEGRVLIGSAPGAQLVLSDATVSAVHCELRATEEGFLVRDLGAKNGVRLGGRRVKEAWLEPKDDLELGDSVVRFTVLEEEEQRPLSLQHTYAGLRGGSVKMRELYSQLERAAATEMTVLIQGETGTGKELVAGALVSEGRRKDRPFVVVDCGALSPTLAESELFGHEKGAFTGANNAFAGAFERAHGGTLFLDEVGELPRDLQPKLLGALERRQIQRLGGSAPKQVDVRVIAATHVELERAVNAGTFRADLFYRLAVIQLRIPALRSRREDIPELVAHFLAQLPGLPTLPAATLRRLCDADYPGNVRELRHAVERAAAGLESAAPPAGLGPGTGIDLAVPYRLHKERVLGQFDQEYLKLLMDACEGNASEAARRSGLSRVHLTTLLQKHGVGGR